MSSTQFNCSIYWLSFIQYPISYLFPGMWALFLILGLNSPACIGWHLVNYRNIFPFNFSYIQDLLHQLLDMITLDYMWWHVLALVGLTSYWPGQHGATPWSMVPPPTNIDTAPPQLSPYAAIPKQSKSIGALEDNKNMLKCNKLFHQQVV